MNTFESDLKFLTENINVLVLKDKSGQSQLILVPDWQGRVMTSTSRGPGGKSYGWINYDLISTGELQKQINLYGGEERFWMGPEGGQFSIFFPSGTDFSFEQWSTPKCIDTEAYELIAAELNSATFRKGIQLQNASQSQFTIEVLRKISLLSNDEITEKLGMDPGRRVSCVAYQSENSIRNTGDADWSRATGLLSIWILGMYNSSDKSSIVIPVKPAEDGSMNINSSYFGEVSADRLQVTDKMIFFKADGKSRSKIGVPPQNVIPVMGSYDAAGNILTIVQFSYQGETSYVNSMWEMQEEPFAGDVANAYNDGPLENGDQLGPFYELESSSPARELKSGDSLVHVHRTFHLEGDPEALDKISREVLGVSLSEIETAFQK